MTTRARSSLCPRPATVSCYRRPYPGLGRLLLKKRSTPLGRGAEGIMPFNNAGERDLRPAVIQRKNTNGYRAMWSAKGEAAVRTVVATARITAGAGTFSTVLGTIGA